MAVQVIYTRLQDPFSRLKLYRRVLLSIWIAVMVSSVQGQVLLEQDLAQNTPETGIKTVSMMQHETKSQVKTVDRPSVTNQLKGSPNDIHALIMDDTEEVFRRGNIKDVLITSKPVGVSISNRLLSKSPNNNVTMATYTSREILTDFPFNEVLPSWNIDIPAGTGFIVEIRAGRRSENIWTSFYYLGRWGSVPQRSTKVLHDTNGIVDIDYFRSQQTFDRIQYRVYLYTTEPHRSPSLRRFSLVYSNTLNNVKLARKHRKTILPGPREKWTRRLAVPFRSQKKESPKIRGSICSPTSVSMVMEYRGINVPTAVMAQNVYDREYNIYGNWNRAVQAAYTCGVPGYLDRFTDWNKVKRYIADDQPVIASIVVDYDELHGAPHKSSNGHLLVIVGFDKDVNVHVNDPAGATEEYGMLTYTRSDMEKVWFGHGGVGYILLPAKATASQPQ